MKYELVRSNRKTLSLSVTREGRVIVRAPIFASEEYISAFVENHTSWINKKLRELSSKERLDLKDGAMLHLFGSRYMIKSGRARISEGVIFLPQEGREMALIRLLKRFSLEVMTILTERIARRFGFQYSNVRISSARGRWGSCNRQGVIAYTFRVAFLLPALCEYVAVHELAHTVQFDHSPAFWRIVEKVLPDWKNRRKSLKLSGVMSFL